MPTDAQKAEGMLACPPEMVGRLVLDFIPADSMDGYLRFVLANIAEIRREMDIFNEPPPPVNEMTIMDLTDLTLRLRQAWVQSGERQAIRDAALELLGHACRFLEAFDRTDPEHLSSHGLT